MKKIVYIGNNLKSTTPTSIVLLSELLETNGFEVFKYSDKKSKLIRILHMCWGVFIHRKADYLLIDTYSTKNFYYALVISQLGRIFSIPYIPILRGGNLPERLLQNPKLSALIFKHSYKNVALSNYLGSYFKKHGYKCSYIPNIIQLGRYQFKERTAIKPNLLWVRSLSEIYNPKMAIEVLVGLKQIYPKATLSMVGPDKDGSLERCKKLTQTFNVQEAVEFTGLLSKEEWIEKSTEFDIFISTTNIDNTPVSVIEAMALGLPVVSTNVGGVPFLIEDGIDGLLVAKGDVQGMVKKIQYIIEENSQYLAKNAREKVSKFDGEIVKSEWQLILK